MINGKYYKRVFAKPQVYKGITFKSTLERDFAMFLDSLKIRWRYEEVEYELIPQEEWIDKTEIDFRVKKTKRNKKHTLQRVIYTPDFILPDYKLVVEVKGKMFDDALFHLRLRLFKSKYPDTAIWVVRHHSEFEKLEEVLVALNLAQDGELK